MTPDPEAVTPGEPVSRAAQIMRTYDISIVPVVSDRDGKHLIGVITTAISPYGTSQTRTWRTEPSTRI